MFQGATKRQVPQIEELKPENIRMAEVQELYLNGTNLLSYKYF